MTGKVDFKKTLDSYRALAGRFRLVEVPPMQYLMVNGHGDPNTSPAYGQALEALYPVAYRIKFASKAAGRDYVVPPLEGLWWADDMDAFTSGRDKSKWDWTMMLLTPDWIGSDEVDAAVAAVAAKKPPDRLGDVRLEFLDEGLCVQTLHVGSFRRRGAGPGADASRVHSRQRTADGGNPSRDLPRRSAPHGSREVADPAAPARHRRSSRMRTLGKPASTESVSAAIVNPACSKSRRVPT